MVMDGGTESNFDLMQSIQYDLLQRFLQQRAEKLAVSSLMSLPNTEHKWQPSIKSARGNEKL